MMRKEAKFMQIFGNRVHMAVQNSRVIEFAFLNADTKTCTTWFS